MAEVLSQSQIDALLNSMQNAGSSQPDKKEAAPEKKYKKYDFYSPKKYTKDKLKMLHNIYDNYARIASSQINGLFKVASEVEVMGVEEQRYYEFSNALSDTDVITIARVSLQDEQQKAPMILHIAPEIMISMIDRMMGGMGTDNVSASYTYTDVEYALYQKIIQYFININKDVWATHIRLDARFDRMEENPSMFQGISVDEAVVIVMLNIKMLGLSGILNVCIPGTLMTDVFEVIDKTKHLVDEDSIQKGDKEDILDNIRNSELDVMAQLGIARLSLDDVYNFQIGDVINLNKPKDSDVTLHIAGQPWFTGQLGVHNKNMAVKIHDRVEES
ncbi:MAG: flagellar motor switch protein FliM [Lachnospiraceae bacterium]|nr:flagellar motor switch protein FliM [Lachnospiraceae bacterium]